MNRSRCRGTTLVEALLALVVTAFSALAALHLQAEIRRQADVTRQRAEAVRHGAAELERLRSFAALAAASAAPGAPAYDAIVDAESRVDAAGGFVSSADYRMRTSVASLAGGAAKALRIEVDWRDSRRRSESIALVSAVAGHDPALGASLALGSGAGTVPGAHGRAHAVPVEARDLGDGTSAWKPSADATVAMRLAHGGQPGATAVPMSLCDGVVATTPTRALTPAQLTSCRPMLAATSLLRGTIRFADASPPDPAGANDVPLPTGVRLVLLGGGHQGAPQCWTERIAAGSDRHVAYTCLVVPRADGRWSARAELLPDGWTLGGGAGDRRVCRLAHDRDGSGAIDAGEHPRDWLDTLGSLLHQNFLVVRGDQACPAGAGLADPWHTEAHQP